MIAVQQGMLLVFGMPFILAVSIAIVNRRRIRTGTPDRTTDQASRAPSDGNLGDRTVDVGLVLQRTAAALDCLASTNGVGIQLAAAPETTACVDSRILAMALDETIRAAIDATPGGRVLITAANVGNGLRIRITDDGPSGDQRIRGVATRDAAALIALQGGSVAVEARPGRGTTVTVRLPCRGKAVAQDNVRDIRSALVTHDA